MILSSYIEKFINDLQYNIKYLFTKVKQNKNQRDYLPPVSFRFT